MCVDKKKDSETSCLDASSKTSEDFEFQKTSPNPRDMQGKWGDVKKVNFNIFLFF